MRKLMVIVIIAPSLLCCKKDKNNTPPPTDCQAKNYGIYKLNFTSATVLHHVVMTEGFGVIEKDFAIGVLADTMHVSAGSHSVNITSHATANSPAIDVEATAITIAQCEELTKNVAF